MLNLIFYSIEEQSLAFNQMVELNQFWVHYHLLLLGLTKNQKLLLVWKKSLFEKHQRIGAMKLTHKLGVIGHPVKHSLSPKIHRAFARQAGLDIIYDKYDIQDADLGPFIKEFFANGGTGLNITVPHKVNCIEFVDSAANEVKRLMSANTLMIKDSSIYAESTDGPGFMQDLNIKKIDITKKNILMLGAGGAAKSVASSICLSKKPNSIFISNRTQSKVNELIKVLSRDEHVTPLDFSEYRTYGDRVKAIDIVINATSKGLDGKFAWEEDIPVDEETIFYDLSYSNGQTSFSEWASQFSNNVFDGKGMLVQQAALSFKHWFGFSPNAEAVEDLLIE